MSGPYRGTTVSPGKVVPLISSYVTGRLGLLHLPRLWLKALLFAKDILAEDWGCGPGGLDKKIMEFVGIDASAFVPWLLQAEPTYEQTEEWVRAHATKLGPETVAASNAFLQTAGLPGHLGSAFRDHLGVDDEGAAAGIMLNNYDDWDSIYRQLRSNDPTITAIVPAISPGTFGLLGVPHLPRCWLKQLLAAAGLLPKGYRLTDERADDAVPGALGISPDAFQKFLVREQPPYVAFESFVASHATQDPRTVRWSDVDGLDPQSLERVHRFDWTLLRADIISATSTGSQASQGRFAFSTSGHLQHLRAP
jgi:hypothetical protein